MTNACDVGMLQRMRKERITISLDAGVAARVRQCGATRRVIPIGSSSVGGAETWEEGVQDQVCEDRS